MGHNGSMRYFRADAAVYVEACAQLDAAWGYPNAETKTKRALPVVAELPADAQGRVYVAIEEHYCDYVLPSEILPQLIAAGLVEELSQAEYLAVARPGYGE